MLELIGVSKSYRSGLFARSEREVLRDVSLTLEKGHFIGLVGESGSGKTTLARVALRLTKATSGSIIIDGVDITSMKKAKLRPIRRRLQIVFQHPETALDPEFKLRESLQEALLRAGTPRSRLTERMAESCALVNMQTELLDRYPSQVSGGEIQRAAIARVLAFEPDYLFLDEPTSMLDISVQAHILNLIRGIASAKGMGVVLISHDLDVIRAMCPEVAVLDAGKLVEQGKVADVLERPTSGRTRALLAAWAAQERREPLALGDEPQKRDHVPRPGGQPERAGEIRHIDAPVGAPAQYQRGKLS